MKYALTLPPIGPYSDPNRLSDLAVEAEQAGWDGFFLWDHFIYFSPYDPKVPMHPFPDPWVSLAAVAAKTERITIGPMVTSLARRRPWKVARETVSLDLLSEGRLIRVSGWAHPPISTSVRSVKKWATGCAPAKWTKGWRFSMACGPASRSVFRASSTTWAR